MRTTAASDPVSGAPNSMASSERFYFSGHQTFPFRYAWLPKGVSALAERPDLFTDDRAILELGVGKNMVASIRHWCEATGVAGWVSPGQGFRPTKLGERLFGEAGWDPYLEDSATLWILHWQLCRQGSRSSVNHLAFTQWNQSLFSRNELVGWLSNLTNQLALRKVSPASLRRDVDVFIRTYVAKPAGGRVPEDSFDCPLTELGLIDEVDSGIYEIRRRAQPTLQNAVLMYAILDYWHSNASAQATLSFDRIMFGPGSPGGAFQLTEADLEVRLSQLPSHYGFEFDQSAGMRRLVRIQVGGQVAPLDVLAGYYKSRL